MVHEWRTGNKDSSQPGSRHGHLPEPKRGQQLRPTEEVDISILGR